MRYHGNYITNQGTQMMAPIYDSNKSRLARDLRETCARCFAATQRAVAAAAGISTTSASVTLTAALIRGKWYKWND